MSIKRKKNGQFAKGNKSGKMFTRESSLGNKHAKGNPPNKTSFKKGENFMENHPSWKGGIQIFKKDGAMKNLGNGKRTRLARYNYEQAFGKIPKGYVIWHKDGNKFNDELSNLEAITRSELLRLNRKS